MIEAVGAWVREIVFIVLFAAFLELLLPDGGMRKFVRVIMGLLIMMAVLNPVIDLMEKSNDEAATVFSGTRNGAYPAAGIAGAADAARERREQLAREYYAKELARQIRATVLSVGGVSGASVTVNLKEDSGREPGNSPTRPPVPPVARVVILAEAATAGTVAIKTVKITVGTPATGQSAAEKTQAPEKVPLNPAVKEKISRVVSELYHLNPEIIEVRP